MSGQNIFKCFTFPSAVYGIPGCFTFSSMFNTVGLFLCDHLYSTWL